MKLQANFPPESRFQAIFGERDSNLAVIFGEAVMVVPVEKVQAAIAGLLADEYIDKIAENVAERLKESGGNDKYIASYRIISNMGKNTHTLELIYTDGEKLSIPLPQTEIDIDRVVQFGTEDPTGETTGQTKQFYINTITGKIWVCENGWRYPTNWIPIQGIGDKLTNICGEIPVGE